MIGCVCKYSPFALFNAFDEEAYRINPFVASFDNADALMHPNICTFSKGVLEECLNRKLNKIFLVNCCDSVRRLKDTVEKLKHIEFVYMIDLPRKIECCSKMLLKNALLKLIKDYEEFSGKKFDTSKFKESIKKYIEPENVLENEKPCIAVVGARAPDIIIKKVGETGAFSVVNYTCTDKDCLYSDVPETDCVDELIGWYAGEILSLTPCLRMADTSTRTRLLENPNIKGIIYHTVKFCDYYPFEYAALRQNTNIPILKIETDCTEQGYGQITTRIEAFLENLKVKKYEEAVIPSISQSNKKIYAAGIDSGSTSTNVVIIDEKRNVVSYSIVNTGSKSIESATKALNAALKKAGIKYEKLGYIVSTGYGRANIPFSNESVTEITCHGRAAHFLDKSIRTVIDIGGQDSKVIRIDENGDVKNFAMNDKCAAGTGRFLDTMAKVLEIDMDHMAEAGLSWKEDLTITSMCTVFAESEVVSLIAQSKDECDIIHGLNKSIAAKTAALVNRVGKLGSYMITGGVAKNTGVVRALEEKLGQKIHIPQEPQICGALGAALIALERMSKKQ